MRYFTGIIFFLLTCSAAEPLRISITTMPVAAPLRYAQEMGLFKEAGLNVELHDYALGKLALEDLLAGKLDAACAAVTPIVYKFMDGHNFKVIGSISSSTGMVAVVARKDLGVTNFTDIAGKRVGLSKGTSGEFFFETMRILNRIPRAKVGIEDLDVHGLYNGLKDGSVEAVSLWEPQIDELKAALTNRLSIFYANGLYTFTWNLVTLTNTITSRRAELEKVMAVLYKAADRIQEDPEAVRVELIRSLGKRGRELSLGLKQTQFYPELGQELLVQMEGEARWIISRDGKTNAVPNFLRCIDSSILKKVRPGAVTLIE